MSLHSTLTRKLALTTIIFALPLNAALAQDAQAVADRMKATLLGQGVDIGWASVEGSGADITLKGVTVKPVAEKNPLPIGDVQLAGVTEADGGYTIEKITTQPFSKTEDGITLDISALEIGGMKIPAEGNTDPLASLMMYESANIASVSVKLADKTAFSMDNFSVEITPPADGNAMEFAGGAEKFSGDLSLINDPQSKPVIEALGYQNITGSMGIEGTWQPSDGRMALTQYDITVDNAGTLGMTFDLGGYTLDFVKQMQEMQKKMAEKPEGADSSAEGMAMLGMMQQLTFHTATVRYDDDSLTNKVIEFVAKSQNMKPEDIKNQAKAIVPFLSAQLNNPELATQISAAVNAFMDDPQNLEIKAAPAAPVPFAQLMAAGMGNPLDLTKTLNVSVTANQSE